MKIVLKKKEKKKKRKNKKPSCVTKKMILCTLDDGISNSTCLDFCLN